MARPRRLVVPHCAHHVVAKSQDQRKIFYNGFVKGRYLRRLSQLAAHYKVLVHAFCLMDNHLHLVVTPTDDTGLSNMLRQLHSWLARTYNRRVGRKGSVFLCRFWAAPMDDNHFFTAMRYVELNPRRAGQKNWRRWVMSSAHLHTDPRKHRMSCLTLNDQALRRRFPTKQHWAEWLDWAEDDSTHMRYVYANRPAGDPDWIQNLQSQKNRRLDRLGPGRPPNPIPLLISAAS